MHYSTGSYLLALLFLLSCPLAHRCIAQEGPADQPLSVEHVWPKYSLISSASLPNDRYGESVALSGSGLVAAVGAPGSDDIYLFRRSPPGGELNDWTALATVSIGTWIYGGLLGDDLGLDHSGRALISSNSNDGHILFFNDYPNAGQYVYKARGTPSGGLTSRSGFSYSADLKHWFNKHDNNQFFSHFTYANPSTAADWADNWVRTDLNLYVAGETNERQVKCGRSSKSGLRYAVLRVGQLADTMDLCVFEQNVLKGRTTIPRAVPGCFMFDGQDENKLYMPMNDEGMAKLAVFTRNPAGDTWVMAPEMYIADPDSTWSSTAGRRMKMSAPAGIMLVDDAEYSPPGGPAALGRVVMLVQTRGVYEGVKQFLPAPAYANEADLRFGFDVAFDSAGTYAVAGSRKESFGVAELPLGLCSVGQSYNASLEECTSCPPGTYGEDRVTCQPCPVGTSSSQPGQTNISTCVPCPTGSAATVGSAFCVACRPGYYGAGVRLGECSPCEAGTSMPRNGSSYCSDCPIGQYSGQASPVCTQCPIGSTTRSFRSSSVDHCVAIAGYYWYSATGKPVVCTPREACVGGRGAESCAFGYVSEMCSQCADDFFRTSAGTCMACDVLSPGLLTAAAVIAALIVVVLAVFPLRVFLAALLSALRPVMHTFQILGIVLSMQIGYSAGSGMASLRDIADIAMLRFPFLNPACTANEKDAVRGWLFSFAPIAVGSLLIAFLLLCNSVFFRRKVLGQMTSDPSWFRTVVENRQRLFNAGLTFWSLLFLPALRLAFLFLDCTEVAPGLYQLDTDSSVRCFAVSGPGSSVWLALVGLGCAAAVFCFCPWIFAVVRVCRGIKKQCLGRPSYRLVLGNLLLDHPLRGTGAVLWSVLFVKLRDCAILFTEMFLSRNAMLQCALMFAIAELSLIFMFLLRPFRQRCVTLAWAVLLLAVQVVLFAGMWNSFLAMQKSVDTNTGPDVSADHLGPTAWIGIAVCVAASLLFSVGVLFQAALDQYALTMIHLQNVVLQPSIASDAAIAQVLRLENFIVWKMFRWLESLFTGSSTSAFYMDFRTWLVKSGGLAVPSASAYEAGNASVQLALFVRAAASAPMRSNASRGDDPLSALVLASSGSSSSAGAGSSLLDNLSSIFKHQFTDRASMYFGYRFALEEYCLQGSFVCRLLCNEKGQMAAPFPSYTSKKHLTVFAPAGQQFDGSSSVSSVSSSPSVASLLRTDDAQSSAGPFGNSEYGGPSARTASARLLLQPLRSSSRTEPLPRTVSSAADARTTPVRLSAAPNQSNVVV